MKIKKICKQCGEEFESYLSDNKTYCSLKCYRKKVCIGKNKSCPICGKIFYASMWKLNANGGKYCTHKCYSKSREKKVVKNCVWCGKSFEIQQFIANKRFRCSRQCDLRNRQKSRISFICQNCGKKFWLPVSGRKHKNIFCSVKCSCKYHKEYSHINNNEPKKKALCAFCGKEMWVTKKRRLTGKEIYCSRDCKFKGRRGKYIPNWEKDSNIYNYFKGFLFPNIPKSQLTNVDKNVINGIILIHKIRRSLNVNK